MKLCLFMARLREVLDFVSQDERSRRVSISLLDLEYSGINTSAGSGSERVVANLTLVGTNRNFTLEGLKVNLKSIDDFNMEVYAGEKLVLKILSTKGAIGFNTELLFELLSMSVTTFCFIPTKEN